MIENGGEQPSSLSLSQKTEVINLAEQAAAAMGIREGIAKGDMVLTSSGPKVIEIAARLSGGWMSSDQIPLATGVDIVGAAIRIALGESPVSELCLFGTTAPSLRRYGVSVPVEPGKIAKTDPES